MGVVAVPAAVTDFSPVDVAPRDGSCVRRRCVLKTEQRCVCVDGRGEKGEAGTDFMRSGADVRKSAPHRQDDRTTEEAREGANAAAKKKEKKATKSRKCVRAQEKKSYGGQHGVQRENGPFSGARTETWKKVTLLSAGKREKGAFE